MGGVGVRLDPISGGEDTPDVFRGGVAVSGGVDAISGEGASDAEPRTPLTPVTPDKPKRSFRKQHTSLIGNYDVKAEVQQVASSAPQGPRRALSRIESAHVMGGSFSGRGRKKVSNAS